MSKTNWMQTYSGVYFDLDHPMPSMVYIEDIAHSLALQPRFNGATYKPYSVAQHCVEVSYRIPCLEALLHDAHEAYTGDITTPVKGFLGEEFYWLVCRIDLAIRIKFNLKPFELIEGLHEADLRMCLTERNQLMAPPPSDWELNVEPYPDYRLIPCDWKTAEKLFLGRFNQLRSK